MTEQSAVELPIEKVYLDRLVGKTHYFCTTCKEWFAKGDGEKCEANHPKGRCCHFGDKWSSDAGEDFQAMLKYTNWTMAQAEYALAKEAEFQAKQRRLGVKWFGDQE